MRHAVPMRVQRRASLRNRLEMPAVVVLSVALVIAIAVWISSDGRKRAHTAAPGTKVHTAPTFTPSPSTKSTPTPTAHRHLAAMVLRHGPDRVSVAAYDDTTGAMISAGARAGMRTASLAKLQLLETLLLQRDRAGTQLDDSQTATVTRMIENSDNNAADDVFADIGGRERVMELEPALGLSPSRTVPGPGYYWGLTRTSAPQQLQLLKNLVRPTSPLSVASRKLALTLMRNVEDDQRWGVPAIADDSSVAAVKNGWLAVDDDDYDESEGAWAVNSAGIVTVEGHRLLVVVMTQHDADFDAGISLVQQFAAAAADAILH